MYLCKVLLVFPDRGNKFVGIYSSDQVIESKLFHLYLSFYGICANVWQKGGSWMDKQSSVNLGFLCLKSGLANLKRGKIKLQVITHLFKDIKANGADLSTLQCLNQCCLIDNLSTSSIYNDHAILTQTELTVADEVICLGTERNADRDHVRCSEQGLEINIFCIVFLLN